MDEKEIDNELENSLKKVAHIATKEDNPCPVEVMKNERIDSLLKKFEENEKRKTSA